MILSRLNKGIESWKAWLPEALVFFGVVVYFLRSLIYAFTLLSVEDEGGYLLKGYWYATGQYIPFQDYGPLTNHMPLAFLIPGYIQLWFGPGLRTGRLFAVFLGVVFILGLWLLSRRLAGRWWAAVAVWAVAVNPALIKMYSVAVSQVLVVTMLIWILYFALGKDRSLVQISLGAGLAGILVLTRLNMTPVLIALLIYLWWQHGGRTALLPAAIGLGISLLGYAYYWPGVLRLWATYTPQGLTSFLDPWRIPPEALPSWTSGASLLGRLLSFLEALRFNFISLVSAVAAWLLWPRLDNWRDASERRMALFLSALLVLLLIMHAVASLGTDYCVFCFPLYSAFFSVLGLLLFMLVWPRRASAQSRGRKIAAGVLLIAIPAALSFGSYSLFADVLPSRALVRSLLLVELPRFADFSLQSGSIPLWGLLENRFGLSYADGFRLLRNGLGYGLMFLTGLLFGLALFWIARRAPKFLVNKLNVNLSGFVSTAMLLLLLTGFALSSSPFLGGGYRSFDCGENVIEAYERLGAELRRQIPHGANIFWRGGRSPTPLLYLTDLLIHPSQLNGDYTYRLAGEPDELQRFGMWGPSVLDDWLQQADLILVEKDLYRTWLQDALENGPYELLATTETLVECSPRSQVLIFAYRLE